MKAYLPIALAALMLPGTLLAQERELDESIFLLQSTDLERFEEPDIDCAWAAPFLPQEVVGGWSSDLYALTTEGVAGEVTGQGEKIGEMWTCFDVGQEVTAPIGPSYENAVAYALFINGEVIGGLGAVRPRQGGGGFPDLFSAGASLSLVVDDVVTDRIGSMTVNEILDQEELYGGRNTIITLRLFRPRDYIKEAAEAATWKM